MNEPHWADSALCAQIDPSLWFPEKGAHSPGATRVCGECRCRRDCLDEAMTEELGQSRQTRFGIRGGLSAYGRYKHEPQWLAERSAA